MLILFTALHRQTHIKSFTFRTDSLEAGLDFITLVSTHGDVILSAKVIDNDRAIKLSVDAFDGECFATPMQKLEQEWQAVLSEPPLTTPGIVQERIDATRRQIDNCEKSMASQTLIMNRFEALLKRVEANIVFDPQKTDLIQHYQSHITAYERQMAISMAYYDRLIQRLTTLVAV